MRRPAISHPLRRSRRVALLALAVAMLLGPTGASADQATKRVAKKAENAALGKTVLTNTRGRTLYTLSIETNGRFGCTGACLSIWPPLIAPAKTTPLGPVKLGTVMRPDGRTQATFKGRPLYIYSGDAKPGDANGEGIRADGGIWHAAALSKVTPQPQPQPLPPQPIYPY
jgi:predicted lipoprotein with Yx(FWY)xxD motif